MVTDESTIRPDSVAAHLLLRIHLERMIMFSQIKSEKSKNNSQRKVSHSRFSPRRLRGGHAIIAIFLMLLAHATMHAQSTAGSIRGVVQDKTGAVVPESQITLHSDDENIDRVINADASGAFLLEDLKPGKYSVHAKHDGFADTNLSGIVLNPRQDLRLTVELAIAETSTTVEVSEGAEQINTENATLADLKTNEQITQLPLNNRAQTTSPLGALASSSNVQQDSAGNIALGGSSSSMVRRRLVPPG